LRNNPNKFENIITSMVSSFYFVLDIFNSFFDLKANSKLFQRDLLNNVLNKNKPQLVIHSLILITKLFFQSFMATQVYFHSFFCELTVYKYVLKLLGDTPVAIMAINVTLNVNDQHEGDINESNLVKCQFLYEFLKHDEIIQALKKYVFLFFFIYNRF
jgi:hypothetical protein